MEFLMDLAAWFAEEGRWLGPDGILPRTAEHLWLALVPMLIAIVIALPLALSLGHRRIGEFSVNAMVNVGRAVPSFGLLILAGLFFIRAGLNFRFWPAVVALVVLAIPPIFTNAYTAVANAPRATVEAARGMGLTESEILWKVEVPMGEPVILAGIRIALIQVLATVPLAAVLSSGGGLGQYVVRGFPQGPPGRVEVFAGAVLIAILTLTVDWVFTRVERAVLPAGVRRLSDTEVRAAAAIS
ncbi:MAG: ABC transporter permease [Acidimicrobiia bacterium]